MLPIPKNDPFITLQMPTDEEYNDLESPEDELLLKTGKWEGNEDNDAE